MDRSFIGDGFYDLLLDIGEDYALTTVDNKVYTGKISVKTGSESPYFLSGTATFPDVNSQTTFMGCYFKTIVDQSRTYMMLSSVPEPTNGKVGTVEVAQCNEIVDLAYLTEGFDDKYNQVTIAKVYQSDVPVYWESTLSKTRQNSSGNYENTTFFAEIPARYAIAVDQVILRNTVRFDEDTEKNLIEKIRYRVDSIDLSKTFYDGDGNIYGVIDVQLSIDTRG